VPEWPGIHNEDVEVHQIVTGTGAIEVVGPPADDRRVDEATKATGAASTVSVFDHPTVGS
jgi:hypothetical protein